MSTDNACPSCHGTGLMSKTYEDWWDYCRWCDGSGEIKE